MKSSGNIVVSRISKDFELRDLANPLWDKAEPAAIDKYWSGEKAPAERGVLTRFLWSRRHFYVRFDCEQHEPLVINDEPAVARKTNLLWEKDVCEIFIGTDKDEPRKYLEFEVAPTGEWIDLTIDLTSGERITGWDFWSGMEATAAISLNRVVMAMKIPFEAFGVSPAIGDLWPGNLYRCVGSGDTRGYMAWQPTLTPEPSYHEPDKFGLFEFGS